jgi:predicted nucleic acid-binding protein
MRSKIEAFIDEMLARDAGLEKCRRRLNLSITDRFALAVAKRFEAMLLTTDGELAKVKDANVKHFKV